VERDAAVDGLSPHSQLEIALSYRSIGRCIAVDNLGVASYQGLQPLSLQPLSQGVQLRSAPTLER